MLYPAKLKVIANGNSHFFENSAGDLFVFLQFNRHSASADVVWGLSQGIPEGLPYSENYRHQKKVPGMIECTMRCSVENRRWLLILPNLIMSLGLRLNPCITP